MRSRSSSLESLVCALYLSTAAVNALPLANFNFWQRDAVPELAARAHIPDPRVMDFDSLVLDAQLPESFQSQDIAPSFVRPSRRRSKGMDGVPARLVDQADELDFGPDFSTFSEDFHEEGDEQPEQFWHVMQALQSASQDTYSAMFDGMPAFRALRKMLPFAKATKAKAAVRRQA
ncbi:hypothetical protein CALVIDRAFT_30429 [Calocera viscosa TUFC12733]|uniref:Uncharacterized protein n=1 Tax=Calocera viscosa (strain TUFC12733) TaxID=1330018 RepID=A0A167PD39_CALVF|nr:hypothetical protein CALVIDRAFT_30429 [Calocera viscosa TUFC12733]